MRLEQMYTDILDMSQDELHAHMVEYSAKRERDLYTPPVEVRTKKKTSTKADTITITPEQVELLKKMKLL